MIGYQHNDTEYLSETINVITGEVIESSMTRFCWNSLILDPDVVETLGDSFGLLGGVSLEGFCIIMICLPKMRIANIHI